MTSDDDQKARWNGPSGHGWVAAQQVLDQVYRPVLELLVDAVPVGRRVLDVGCGTGATTVAAAHRVGPAGRCVGVDVSEPMLEAARARAERDGAPVTFIHADAQRYPFEPASFELVMSRFGVMFFDDSQAAFANLRRAVGADGALRLVVWRDSELNPFMTVPEHAVAEVLGIAPKAPSGPGPFAFAEPATVEGLLTAAGWTGFAAQPADVPCTMPLADLEGYYTRIGAVAAALRELPEAERAGVTERVRPAFDQFVKGDEVHFTAAVWVLTAQAA